MTTNTSKTDSADIAALSAQTIRLHITVDDGLKSFLAAAVDKKAPTALLLATDDDAKARAFRRAESTLCEAFEDLARAAMQAGEHDAATWCLLMLDVPMNSTYSEAIRPEIEDEEQEDTE